MKELSTETQITDSQREELLTILKQRFEANMHRHPDITWESVAARLNQTDKWFSLSEMERTGGEPDVVGADSKSGAFIFYDCSPETPKGRRSTCYDQQALDARKEHKPATSAIGMAKAMGIDILDEQQYRALQLLGKFDSKTSSWIKTPEAIRELDGALFGDFRYNHVFVYHNGVQSYYAVRGFRGCISI